MSDTTINNQNTAPQPQTPTMTPDQSAAVTPQPQMPTQAPAAPAAAPATAPQKAHQSILNHILTMATGGDTYYTDENGQRKIAPQSSGTLGKTLIAATLAGLLSKDEYRQTPYGPVRDYSGTGANAVAAAQGVTDKMRQAPQKLSDEAQSRKLFTLQANANTYKIMSAMALQKSATLDSQIDTAAPMLKGVDDALLNLGAGEKAEDIRTGQHLSMEDAQAKLKGGLMDWIAVPDGKVMVLNPETGQNEPHPTYSIVNPHAKITLSPDAAKIAALTNPAYNNLHDVVGGEVKVPISIANAANQEVQTAHLLQHEADTLSASGLGEKVDIMAAVKKNRQLIPAMDAARDQIASGQSPWRVLDAISTSKNGMMLLDAMGISQEEANKYIKDHYNEEIKEAKIASFGGSGKAPAPEGMVTDQMSNLTSSDLPEDQKQNFLARVPETHDGVSTLDQAQKWGKDVQTALTAWNKQKIEQGDPAEISKTADRYITSGDPSSLSAYFSSRKDVKEKVENAMYQKAVDLGIDPTRFTGTVLDNKSKTYQDYNGNKKGSTAAQITSFNAVVQHMANAVDASERLANKTLGSTRQPVMNTAMDVIGKQLTNDPDWKTFSTSLVPVQDEITNFLKAGYAPHSEDTALMKTILDPHETPTRILAAIKSLAETADIRLAEMGRSYLTAMDTTKNDLVSPGSAATFQRLGIKSKAAEVGATLPRGWQNNQLQTMTDPKVGLAYLHAAGGDATKAKWLARQNGWNE